MQRSPITSAGSPTTFALDTATPSPALAVTRGEEVVADLRLGPSPAGGRRVLEAAHHLLEAAGVELADVERIVVGVGPGGFTGLRIGIATALALGQALGAPVVGASSIEALALGIARSAPAGALVAPVIDARRREVFGALYAVDAGGGLEEILAPAARSPDDLAGAVSDAAAGAAVTAGGDGAAVAEAALTARGIALLPPGRALSGPSAVDLVRRADGGGALPAAPRYLRLPDAEVNRRAAARARSAA